MEKMRFGGSETVGRRIFDKTGMRGVFALFAVMLIFLAGCSTFSTGRPEIRQQAVAAAPDPVAAPETGPTRTFTERMNDIPDLVQTDPNARFPHGGVHYCGPCAVSNSLAWLAGQGYPNLMARPEEVPTCQIDLANVLASKKYLDTTLELGTTPTDLLTGVSRYIQDHGYSYRRLQYKGWRKHPAEYSTGDRIPDLDWIEDGLYGHSAVWLNIGWYKYESRDDRYKRLGGHWVTVVGFGVDENGRANPNMLVIHDPGAEDQGGSKHEYVKIVRIASGTLAEPGSGSIGATGFMKLFGGALPNGRKAFGIVDGAVVLEMQASNTLQPAPAEASKESGSTRDGECPS